MIAPLAAQQPDNLALQYLLGTALIRNHQTQEGRQAIDRILQHGENAEANLLMAQMSLATENYATANASIEKAITEDHTMPDAYMLSGVAKEGLTVLEGLPPSPQRGAAFGDLNGDVGSRLATPIAARKLLDSLYSQKPRKNAYPLGGDIAE